jgi:hypothetical protein
MASVFLDRASHIFHAWQNRTGQAGRLATKTGHKNAKLVVYSRKGWLLERILLYLLFLPTGQASLTLIVKKRASTKEYNEEKSEMSSRKPKEILRGDEKHKSSR